MQMPAKPISLTWNAARDHWGTCPRTHAIRGGRPSGCSVDGVSEPLPRGARGSDLARRILVGMGDLRVDGAHHRARSAVRRSPSRSLTGHSVSLPGHTTDERAPTLMTASELTAAYRSLCRTPVRDLATGQQIGTARRRTMVLPTRLRALYWVRDMDGHVVVRVDQKRVKLPYEVFRHGSLVGSFIPKPHFDKREREQPGKWEDPWSAEGSVRVNGANKCGCRNHVRCCCGVARTWRSAVLRRSRRVEVRVDAFVAIVRVVQAAAWYSLMSPWQRERRRIGLPDRYATSSTASGRVGRAIGGADGVVVLDVLVEHACEVRCGSR